MMPKYFLLMLVPLMLWNCTAQNKTKTMKDTLKHYQFRTHFLDLNNGELAYVQEGNGKDALLFVHGLSSNADAWYRNIEDLKTDFTCIAVDLPGYGKSYKSGSEYTATAFASVLEEFLKKKKISQVTLIGYSMGGQAAIKFAAKYPQMVKKLILVAPAGIEEFTALEANMMKMAVTPEGVIATPVEQIDKNYAMNFHRMPIEAQGMIMDRKNIIHATDFPQHAAAIAQSVAGMLDDKVIDDIPKISMPVLLLFAENDLLIPNKYLHRQMTIQDVAQKAETLFRNSKTVMIPEAGHFLQFEKPQEVNRQIRDFLKIAE